MVSPLVPGDKLAMARGLQKVSHGGSGGCQLVCQLVYQSKKTTAEEEVGSSLLLIVLAGGSP